MESLVASGAKTRTLTIGGQSVSFTVAAATTSTSPETVSQAKSGMDKETWLSDEYKEARSKSASAQFGSKGQKQRAAAAPSLANDNRKPAVIETVSVSRTVSSVSTGTKALDSPIQKKSGKEKLPKAAAAPPSLHVSAGPLRKLNRAFASIPTCRSGKIVG